MKLYTEEEIKRTFGFSMNKMHFDGFMNAMKPIELPSDEEMDNASLIIAFDRIEFIKGAKWVIDKIKNQQL